MNGDQLHVHHVFDMHTPIGAVTDATAPPAQQNPLKPTPAGPQDNPIAAAGDISNIDLHDPRSSSAPGVSAPSNADIGVLGKHGLQGVWRSWDD